MNPTLSNLMKIMFDFEALLPDTIALQPNHIERAIQLSLQIDNELRQWQTYLNVLAMFAFEQWVEHRAPDIPIDREKCSILKPPSANIIDAICNLNIGNFKVCLTAVASVIEEAIALPKAVIDFPEYTAHFYVLVEVREELEEARIYGFMSSEKIGEARAIASLQEADEQENYSLPLALFDTDSDNLMLYLRCLEPSAILLPTEATDSTRDEINRVSLADRLNATAQQMLNVGLWLRDEMDELAQGLSWVLLPAFSPEAVPLRSPTQELEVILTELERGGTLIPENARGAYQDLQLAQSWVRLYAVTWPILSVDNIPEWTLLLVLGSQPGYNLPDNLILRVSDETGVLVERALNRETGDSYIYARVAGTWNETFLVTIALRNSATLTLPPFAFRPNQTL